MNVTRRRRTVARVETPSKTAADFRYGVLLGLVLWVFMNQLGC